ncbi:G-protein coupled receptor Mth2-like [Zootermopsis nevadensis]|uniref:G-protein coupled receptor Mth2-like n=1 Tax=Zootermopsis nevadensis TaxID=136037 RepID=UPI000B8E211C|nr:G-protein coupled receptor Mth2-like [Zootermopsis nevadensis]
MLFLYTAARIISVRRETAILSRAGNTSGSAIHRDRQRLVLYVKLFCLMGLTWITEIISWAVGGADYYWYITDIVNMLRAVLIFVIFCCKKSVLNLLRVRLESFLPCAKRITCGKSGTSLSDPTSSLQLTTSIKRSTKTPSHDT